MNDTIGSWGTKALRIAGNELSALARVALALPLSPLAARDAFDPAAPHPTPVVLVHGFLGHPTNFLDLRRVLAARGFGNVVSHAYAPRLDYPRLAPALEETIERARRTTGAARVDVVGHSLGGLVARYLVETGYPRVRRLVTLGAPYLPRALPARELALFGADDPLVPAPDPHRGPQGRTLVVPACGHIGLLHHPVTHRAVADFLEPTDRRAARPVLSLLPAAA